MNENACVKSSTKTEDLLNLSQSNIEYLSGVLSRLRSFSNRIGANTEDPSPKNESSPVTNDFINRAIRLHEETRSLIVELDNVVGFLSGIA